MISEILVTPNQDKNLFHYWRTVIWTNPLIRVARTAYTQSHAGSWTGQIKPTDVFMWLVLCFQNSKWVTLFNNQITDIKLCILRLSGLEENLQGIFLTQVSNLDLLHCRFFTFSATRETLIMLGWTLNPWWYVCKKTERESEMET